MVIHSVYFIHRGSTSELPMHKNRIGKVTTGNLNLFWKETLLEIIMKNNQNEVVLRATRLSETKYMIWYNICRDW